MSSSSKLQINFFYVLLVAISIVCILIFLPYWSSLFLAVVLAVVFQPLYARVLRLCARKASLSALITLIIVCTVVLVPLSTVTVLLFQEAQAGYSYFTDEGGSIEAMEYVGRVQIFLNQFIPEQYVPNATITEVENYLNRGYTWLGDHFQAVFSNVLGILVNAIIFIFAFFFFLRDGHRFKEILLKLSPLNDVHDESILHRMSLSINSVVKGTLFVALIQGVIAGAGFWFFGVPSPILWGSVTVFTSLIPGFGVLLTVIPAAFFLGATQGTWWGVGLFLWGFFLGGSVDNFIRPIFFKRGSKIHPFLILLSVLGGILLFGAIGFLAGPIILSLLFALLEIYPDVISSTGGVRAASQLESNHAA